MTTDLLGRSFCTASRSLNMSSEANKNTSLIKDGLFNSFPFNEPLTPVCSIVWCMYGVCWGKGIKGRVEAIPHGQNMDNALALGRPPTGNVLVLETRDVKHYQYYSFLGQVFTRLVWFSRCSERWMQKTNRWTGVYLT